MHSKTQYFSISSPKRQVLQLDRLIPSKDVLDTDEALCETAVSLCVHIPDLQPLWDSLAICFALVVLLGFLANNPHDIISLWVTEALTSVSSDFFTLAFNWSEKSGSALKEPSVAGLCDCGWPISQHGADMCIHCKGWTEWQLSLSEDDPDFCHVFHS